MMLLKIGSTDITDMLTSYKVTYAKLWSKDTGRSMTGESKGTLIGIFPKIEVTTGKLTNVQAASLIALTSLAHASVTYYDSIAQTTKTAYFYFGDVADEIARQSTMSHKGISFSIIADKRRE